MDLEAKEVVKLAQGHTNTRGGITLVGSLATATMIVITRILPMNFQLYKKNGPSWEIA